MKQKVARITFWSCLSLLLLACVTVFVAAYGVAGAALFFGALAFLAVMIWSIENS